MADTTTAQPQGTAQAAGGANDEGKKQPTVILCIGMAGSVRRLAQYHMSQISNLQGKTTLMQRLNSYLHTKGTPPYVLNLDPAVTHMPYTANIDIRDTVDYKEVMKQCVHRFAALVKLKSGTTSVPTAVS